MLLNYTPMLPAWAFQHQPWRENRPPRNRFLSGLAVVENSSGNEHLPPERLERLDLHPAAAGQRVSNRQ